MQSERHKNRASIRVLKKIFRFLVGFIVFIYLSLMLLTSLPAFQRWSAGVVSHFLEDKIESRVTIERMRISPLGRIVLDDVKIYDQQDTLMLQASRMAATIDFLPLLKKKIRISGAQLISAKAKFYKENDEKPCNFQFFIDAFTNKNSKRKVDLSFGLLVLRHCDISFDRLYKPHSPGKFNPNHLHLNDLRLTTKVLFKQQDTLSIDLRNLAFVEQSGLQVKRLSFKADAGKHNASVRDFLLELPETSVNAECAMNNVHFLGGQEGEDSFKSQQGECSFSGGICPRDLACFVPKLASFGDVVNLSSDIKLENGILRFADVSVSDNRGNISLLCDGRIENIKVPSLYYADIKELRTGPGLQQFLTQNLQGQAKEISPILTRLGSTKSSGRIDYQNREINTYLLTEFEQGDFLLDGTLKDMQDVQAFVATTDFPLGNLLNLSGENKGTTLSLEANIRGHLPGKGKQAKLSAGGTLYDFIYRGYEHRHMPFTAALDGKTISGALTKDEPNGQAMVNCQLSIVNGKRSIMCQAQLKDFAPHNMNLTKGYEGERFSGSLDADFSDIDLNNLQGELQLTGLEVASEDKGTLRIGDVVFKNETTDDGQHLIVQSDYLKVKADGNISWKTLPASFTQFVRQNLPHLFKEHNSHQQASGNNFHFTVEVQDTVLAKRLLASDFRMPKRSTFEGTISDAIGHISLQMHIPQLQIAGQQLQNIDGRAEAGRTFLQAGLQGERLVKGKAVSINLDAYAQNDKMTSRLRWDSKTNIKNEGDISITSNICHDLEGKPAVDAKINKSFVCIGDSLWNIEPAVIKYHDKVIDVENLSISQAEKHINIDGRVSKLDSDTLRAELQDIDISYIMDLVNFHKVDFDGLASGSVYATSLMKKPYADALLEVRDFTFNAAPMGDMSLKANWGNQESTITLDTDMKGPAPEHHTQVKGGFYLGKEKASGLDLNIQTSKIDLSFLNKFTSTVFSNLQGRASGWTRVFGPFKDVNMEGDMFVDELKTHVLATGVEYHLEGDSVIMRPDNIWMRGARLYDYLGMPGMSEHTAIANAHLMHDAFADLRYDVSIDANNILCYNFPHQGGMSFFGTVYADAQMHLSGDMKSTTIDVTATPMPGTTVNYNTATTGTIDETEFVTYYSKEQGAWGMEQEDISDPDNPLAPRSLPLAPTPDDRSSSDIRINFDIDANPNAQMRILMDPATGDNISLYGNGRLRAHYYNKGRFQMFGTYRVTEGNYRMSIRDVIRKDFTFQPDGTLIFGGDAMQAALNLTAKHTVPNVSLDDLSATGLGLSNTRVDCIMKIGGIAKEPVISFDFDIPNANEDEKQMVRSMLNSEEERDMQAIYLLGVGRFYSYGSFIDKRQTQGGMAMNSVLSSALSSRFNQIMSQALGGTGWTLGTNLRTGEEGWERVDAEALVSGKMLSGRLLFNGNFGYRENKYKMGSNNFIGDFDIQYRLSPRSPFSLKAYNQTNDRYFTQSSLTTQGIGIKFQRDFNRFKELFLKAKKNTEK